MKIKVEALARGQLQAFERLGIVFQQRGGHLAGPPVTVRRNGRGLGQDVDPGEEGESGIETDVHHVTEPFCAHQLEGQHREDRLQGGDHLGAGQPRLADPAIQAPLEELGEQDEQGGTFGFEVLEGLPVQLPHLGHLGHLRADDRGALVITSAGQFGEALLAEDLMNEHMAEGAVLGPEDGLDVVDGVVLFSKLDDPFTGRVMLWRCLGTRFRRLEETQASAAQLPGQGIERCRGIAEALGDLFGAASFAQVGPEGFVLTLWGWRKKSAPGRGLVVSSLIHTDIYYTLYLVGVKPVGARFRQTSQFFWSFLLLWEVELSAGQAQPPEERSVMPQFILAIRYPIIVRGRPRRPALPTEKAGHRAKRPPAAMRISRDFPLGENPG